MSVILCIQNPHKPTMSKSEWESFGRSCRRGLYFDEMFSINTQYTLEIPDGVYPPAEFYCGFFENVIRDHGRDSVRKVSTRSWSEVRHSYKTLNGTPGFVEFYNNYVPTMMKDHEWKIIQPI